MYYYFFCSNVHNAHKHSSTEDTLEMGGNLVRQIKFFVLQSCAEKSVLLVEIRLRKYHRASKSSQISLQVDSNFFKELSFCFNKKYFFLNWKGQIETI